MTAERWWVRSAARWVARVDGVKGHLNLGFQAMTGVSLASGALKYFGYQRFVPHFLVVTVGLTLLYAYLYSEGGVWNQVERDQHDLSTNFSGPNMRMDNPLIGAAVFAAQEGRPPTEEEFAAIDDAVERYWYDYRDGVSLEAD